MKTIIKKYSAIAGTALLILFPKQAIYGACKGLSLWYSTVLPTLLPFLLLTGMMIRSNEINGIMNKCSRFFELFLGFSCKSSIILLFGLLCGYPMTAHLYGEQQNLNSIEENDCQFFIAHATLPSIMFVIGYIKPILPQKYSLIFLLSLYLPVLISLVIYRITAKTGSKNKSHGKMYEKAGAKSFYAIIEDTIQSSVNTIVRIGIIIMIFSIIMELICHFLPASSNIVPVISGFLELTSGAKQLEAVTDKRILGILLCFFTSFGGLCVSAQTISQCHNKKIYLSKIMSGKFLQGIISASVFALLSFSIN